MKTNENLKVVPCADKKPGSKSKSKDMVLYRPIKFRDLAELNQEMLRERRQLWILLAKWLVVTCTLVPAMFWEWRYVVWAIYVPATLLALAAWDYTSHIKHFLDVKKELKELALRDDPYEQNFVKKRPDRADIVYPYIIYLMVIGTIIGAYTMMDIYDNKYGNSVLMKTIKPAAGKSSAKPGLALDED